MQVLAMDESALQVNEQIKAINQRRTPEEVNCFRNLAAIVIGAIEQGYEILGDLFQLMQMHDPEGQHFSPPDVAKLIAYIAFCEDQTAIKEQLDSNKRITICDDACGSGGLLIAAADYIQSLGYDPIEVATFEGTDLDRSCFDMAYIQLAARGLPAIIRHGNTLTQEIKEVRVTPMLKLYKCWQWEQQQRQSAIDGAFNLFGYNSNVRWEPVPFSRWRALPHSGLVVPMINTDQPSNSPTEVIDEASDRPKPKSKINLTEQLELFTLLDEP